MVQGEIQHFPIIIYPSEDGIGGVTAHCLSLDLLCEADTATMAIKGLMATIECQIEYAEKYNASMGHHAPQEYWDMLDATPFDNFPPDSRLTEPTEDAALPPERQEAIVQATWGPSTTRPEFHVEEGD